MDEKVRSVIESLSEGYTDADFLAKFKEVYPKDYENCRKVFFKEERKTKPGKTHPMQHPDKHIVNALHSYLNRRNN